MALTQRVAGGIVAIAPTSIALRCFCFIEIAVVFIMWPHTLIANNIGTYRSLFIPMGPIRLELIISFILLMRRTLHYNPYRPILP